MSILTRRKIPLFLVIIFFLIMMVDYTYYDDWWHTNIYNVFNRWGMIIGAFGGGIGFLMLMGTHLKTIHMELGTEERRYTGKIFDSIIIIIPTVILTIAGLFTSEGVNHPLYQFWVLTFNLPMESLAKGMVVFWMVAAMFRVLRAKNFKMGCLVAVFIISVAGTSPLITTYMPFLGGASKWVNDIMLVAMQRAIMTVAFLGGIFLTFRILLGREKAVFGGEG